MSLTKNRSTILLALIAAIVLLCAAWAGNEDSKKAKWEYKYQCMSTGIEGTPQFQDMLTQAGSEGWDLIAINREQPGGLIHLYFKRAK